MLLKDLFRKEEDLREAIAIVNLMELFRGAELEVMDFADESYYTAKKIYYAVLEEVEYKDFEVVEGVMLDEFDNIEVLMKVFEEIKDNDVDNINFKNIEILKENIEFYTIFREYLKEVKSIIKNKSLEEYLNIGLSILDFKEDFNLKKEEIEKIYNSSIPLPIFLVDNCIENYNYIEENIGVFKVLID